MQKEGRFYKLKIWARQQAESARKVHAKQDHLSDASSKALDSKRAAKSSLGLWALGIVGICAVGSLAYLASPNAPTICELAREAATRETHSVTDDYDYDPGWPKCMIMHDASVDFVEDFANKPGASPADQLSVVLDGYYTLTVGGTIDIRAVVMLERHEKTGTMKVTSATVK